MSIKSKTVISELFLLSDLLLLYLYSFLPFRLEYRFEWKDNFDTGH